MGRPKAPRIARSVPELGEALRRHVKLLREYARRAFEEGDPAFLGEVAGKLRLLVLERGSNAPLLLYLLDEFEMDIEVPMREPLRARTLSLDDYLDSLAFAGRTSTGYVRLSHSDVIAAWAQQSGAAHEDWEFEESFARFAFSGISVGGRSASVAMLHNITKTVLSAADNLLAELTPERLAALERIE